MEFEKRRIHLVHFSVDDEPIGYKICFSSDEVNSFKSEIRRIYFRKDKFSFIVETYLLEEEIKEYE